MNEQLPIAEKDAPFATEVGRAYLAIADLSEATIAPSHAIDIAEWAVNRRHRVRNQWDRLTSGETRVRWQARALREHLTRVTPPDVRMSSYE